MPGRIPDRWEEYEPLGKPIPGTRFLAFKVPLEEGMCHRVAQELKFTPTMFVEKMKSLNHDVGLVIDLTFTKRYYKPQELTDQGIKYRKLFTEGHVIPGKKVRTEFFKVIDDFLEENADNEKLLAIHCTHGLNRTGYMVCRYMIDRLSFTPENAIEAFNKARGYDMERENYLEDLRTGKSHEASDFVEPEPIPERHTASHAARREDGDASKARKRYAEDDDGSHKRRKRSYDNDYYYDDYENGSSSYSGGYERTYNGFRDSYSGGAHRNRYSSWGPASNGYGRHQSMRDRPQYGHGDYWDRHGYPSKDWNGPRPYSRPSDSYSRRPRGRRVRGGYNRSMLEEL